MYEFELKKDKIILRKIQLNRISRNDSTQILIVVHKLFVVEKCGAYCWKAEENIYSTVWTT